MTTLRAKHAAHTWDPRTQKSVPKPVTKHKTELQGKGEVGCPCNRAFSPNCQCHSTRQDYVHQNQMGQELSTREISHLVASALQTCPGSELISGDQGRGWVVTMRYAQSWGTTKEHLPGQANSSTVCFQAGISGLEPEGRLQAPWHGAQASFTCAYRETPKPRMGDRREQKRSEAQKSVALTWALLGQEAHRAQRRLGTWGMCA